MTRQLGSTGAEEWRKARYGELELEVRGAWMECVTSRDDAPPSCVNLIWPNDSSDGRPLATSGEPLASSARPFSFEPRRWKRGTGSALASGCALTARPC